MTLDVICTTAKMTTWSEPLHLRAHDLAEMIDKGHHTPGLILPETFGAKKQQEQWLRV